MPCRDDGYDDKAGGGPNWNHPFDTAGALCDVLEKLEHKYPHAYANVDKKTLEWWKNHQQGEQDKIKQEALAKLSPKEKRALGLKD